MTPPRGWTAPGCAGGTRLDVDPVVRVAEQAGPPDELDQWAEDTLTRQARDLGLLPAGAGLEHLDQPPGPGEGEQR